MRKLDSCAPFDAFLQISRSCIEFEEKKVEEEEAEAYNAVDAFAVKNAKTDGGSCTNIPSAPLASQTDQTKSLSRAKIDYKNVRYQPIVVVKRLEKYTQEKLRRLLRRNGVSTKYLHSISQALRSRVQDSQPSAKKYRRILSTDQISHKIKPLKRKFAEEHNKNAKKQCRVASSEPFETVPRNTSAKPSLHGQNRSLFDSFPLRKESSQGKEKVGSVKVTAENKQKSSDKPRILCDKIHTEKKLSSKDVDKLLRIQNNENGAAALIGGSDNRNVFQSLEKQKPLKCSDSSKASLMTNYVDKTEQKNKLVGNNTSPIRLPLNNNTSILRNPETFITTHKTKTHETELTNFQIKINSANVKPSDGLSLMLTKSDISKENSSGKSDQCSNNKDRLLVSGGEGKHKKDKLCPTSGSEKRKLHKGVKEKHLNTFRKQDCKDKFPTNSVTDAGKDKTSTTIDRKDHVTEKLCTEVRWPSLDIAKLVTALSSVEQKSSISSIEKKPAANGSEKASASSGTKKTPEFIYDKKRSTAICEKKPSTTIGEKKSLKISGEKQQPLISGEKTALLTTFRKKAPLTTGEKKLPLTTVEKTVPLTIGEKKAPLAIVEKKVAPLTTVEKKVAPLTTVEKAAPLTTVEKAAPLTTVEKKVALLSTVEKKVAQLTAVEKKVAPLTTVEKKVAPKLSGEKKAPVPSSEKKAPVPSSEKKAPVTSGEKDPFPSGEKRAPFPSGEKRAPVPSSEKKAPVTSGEKDPFPSGEKRALFPSGEKRAPVPSSEKKAPVPSGEKKAPVPSGEKKAPIPSGEKKAPVPSGEKKAPVPSGEKKAPVPSGEKKAPVPSGEKKAPVPSGEKKAPVPSGEKKAPVPSGEKKAPVPSGEKKAPVPSGEKKAPVPSGEKKAPVPSGEKKAPVPSGEKKAPVPSGEKKAPVPSGEKKAPVPSGEKKAPVPSGEKQAPVPSGEKQAPVPSGEKQVPVPSGEKQAPVPSGEKLSITADGKKPLPLGSSLNKSLLAATNDEQPSASKSSEKKHSSVSTWPSTIDCGKIPSIKTRPTATYSEKQHCESKSSASSDDRKLSAGSGGTADKKHSESVFSESKPTPSTALCGSSLRTNESKPPSSSGDNLLTDTRDCPSTNCAGKRPLANSEDKSLSLSVGERRPSAGVGERRPSAGVGERRPSAGVGERRPSASIGERRPSASIGERRPSASVGERRPSASVGERRPSASGGERRPSTSDGERKPSTNDGERRPSTSSGERRALASHGERRPSRNDDQRHPSVKHGERRLSRHYDERHSSRGSREKHSSGSGRERHPSGSRERHPSGSGRAKHPSGSVRERHPSGGGRERHPSGGGREKHLSQSVQERRPSASFGENRPSTAGSERQPSAADVNRRPLTTGVDNQLAATSVESPASVISSERMLSKYGEGGLHTRTDEGSSTIVTENSINNDAVIQLHNHSSNEFIQQDDGKPALGDDQFKSLDNSEKKSENVTVQQACLYSGMEKGSIAATSATSATKVETSKAGKAQGTGVEHNNNETKDESSTNSRLKSPHKAFHATQETQMPVRSPLNNDQSVSPLRSPSRVDEKASHHSKKASPLRSPHRIANLHQPPLKSPHHGSEKVLPVASLHHTDDRMRSPLKSPCRSDENLHSPLKSPRHADDRMRSPLKSPCRSEENLHSPSKSPRHADDRMRSPLKSPCRSDENLHSPLKSPRHLDDRFHSRHTKERVPSLKSPCRSEDKLHTGGKPRNDVDEKMQSPFTSSCSSDENLKLTLKSPHHAGDSFKSSLKSSHQLDDKLQPRLKSPRRDGLPSSKSPHSTEVKMTSSHEKVTLCNALSITNNHLESVPSLPDKTKGQSPNLLESNRHAKEGISLTSSTKKRKEFCEKTNKEVVNNESETMLPETSCKVKSSVTARQIGEETNDKSVKQQDVASIAVSQIDEGKMSQSLGDDESCRKIHAVTSSVGLEPAEISVNLGESAASENIQGEECESSAVTASQLTSSVSCGPATVGDSLPSVPVAPTGTPAKTSLLDGMSCSSTSEEAEVSYTTRDSLLSAGATSDDDQVGLMERVTYAEVEGVSSDSLGMGATNVYGVPEGAILDTEDNDLGLMIADVRGQAADIFESYDSPDPDIEIGLPVTVSEFCDFPPDPLVPTSTASCSSENVCTPSEKLLHQPQPITQSQKVETPAVEFPSPSKYNDKILEPLYHLLDEVEKETDDIVVDSDCKVVVGGNKLESKESLSKLKLEQQFMPDSSDDSSTDGDLIIDTQRSESHDVELSRDSSHVEVNSMPSVMQLRESFHEVKDNSAKADAHTVKLQAPPPLEWKLQKISNLQERPQIPRHSSLNLRPTATKGTTTDGASFSKPAPQLSNVGVYAEGLVDPRLIAARRISGDLQSCLSRKRSCDAVDNSDASHKKVSRESPRADRTLDMPSISGEATSSVHDNLASTSSSVRSEAHSWNKSQRLGDNKHHSMDRVSVISSAKCANLNEDKSVAPLSNQQGLHAVEPSASAVAVNTDRHDFRSGGNSQKDLASKGTSTANLPLSDKIVGPTSELPRSTRPMKSQKIQRLKNQLEEWKQLDERQQPPPPEETSAAVTNKEDLVQTALDAAFIDDGTNDGEKVTDDEEHGQQKKSPKKGQRGKIDAAQKLKTMMAVQDIVDQARESRLAQELPGYNWLEAKIKSGDLATKPPTPRKLAPAEHPSANRVTPPANRATPPSGSPSPNLSSPQHGANSRQEYPNSSGATNLHRRVLPRQATNSPSFVGNEDPRSQVSVNAGPVATVGYQNILALSAASTTLPSTVLPTTQALSTTIVPTGTMLVRQAQPSVMSGLQQHSQTVAVSPGTTRGSTNQLSTSYTPVTIPISPPPKHQEVTRQHPTSQLSSQSFPQINSQTLLVSSVASVQVQPTTTTVTTVASTKPTTQTSRLSPIRPKPSPTIAEQPCNFSLVTTRIRLSQPILSEPNTTSASLPSATASPSIGGNSVAAANSSPVAELINSSNSFSDPLVSVNSDETLIPVSNVHSPVLVNAEQFGSFISNSVSDISTIVENSAAQSHSWDGSQNPSRTLVGDGTGDRGKSIWNPIEIPVCNASESQLNSNGARNSVVVTNIPTTVIHVPNSSSGAIFTTSVVSAAHTQPHTSESTIMNDQNRGFLLSTQSPHCNTSHAPHQTNHSAMADGRQMPQAQKNSLASKEQPPTFYSNDNDVICITLPSEEPSGERQTPIAGVRRSLTPQEIQRLNDQTTSQVLSNISKVAAMRPYPPVAVTQSHQSVYQASSSDTASQPPSVNSGAANYTSRSETVVLHPSQNSSSRTQDVTRVGQPSNTHLYNQSSVAVSESGLIQSNSAYNTKSVTPENVAAGKNSEHVAVVAPHMRPQAVVQPTSSTTSVTVSRTQSLTDLNIKSSNQLDKEMETRKSELLELERLAEVINEERSKLLVVIQEKLGHLKEMEQTMQQPSVSASSAAQPSVPSVPEPPPYPGPSSISAFADSRKRQGDVVASGIPEKRPAPASSDNAQSVYITPTQNGFIRAEGLPPYHVSGQQPSSASLPLSSAIVPHTQQNTVDKTKLQEEELRLLEAEKWLQTQPPEKQIWLQQARLRAEAKMQAEQMVHQAHAQADAAARAQADAAARAQADAAARAQAEAAARAQAEAAARAQAEAAARAQAEAAARAQAEAAARAQAEAATRAQAEAVAQAKTLTLSQPASRPQTQRQHDETRATQSMYVGRPSERYGTVANRTVGEAAAPPEASTSCATCMAVTGSNRCWMHSDPSTSSAPAASGQNVSQVLASAQAASVTVRQETTTLMTYSTNQVVENRVDSSHLNHLASVVASAGHLGHGRTAATDQQPVPVQQHRTVQQAAQHRQVPPNRTVPVIPSAQSANEELQKAWVQQMKQNEQLKIQQQLQRQQQQQQQFHAGAPRHLVQHQASSHHQQPNSLPQAALQKQQLQQQLRQQLQQLQQQRLQQQQHPHPQQQHQHHPHAQQHHHHHTPQQQLVHQQQQQLVQQQQQHTHQQQQQRLQHIQHRLYAQQQLHQQRTQQQLQQHNQQQYPQYAQLQPQQHARLELGSDQLPAPVPVRRLPGSQLTQGPYNAVHAVTSGRVPHAPIPTYPAVAGQNVAPPQEQQSRSSNVPASSSSSLPRVASSTTTAVPAPPPNPRASSPELRCHNCQQQASFMCSECKQAWYCRQECQMQDWPRHCSICQLSKGNNPTL